AQTWAPFPLSGRDARLALWLEDQMPKSSSNSGTTDPARCARASINAPQRRFILPTHLPVCDDTTRRRRPGPQATGAPIPAPGGGTSPGAGRLDCPRLPQPRNGAWSGSTCCWRWPRSRWRSSRRRWHWPWSACWPRWASWWPRCSACWRSGSAARAATRTSSSTPPNCTACASRPRPTARPVATSPRRPDGNASGVAVLSVNLNKIAVLRNSRGGDEPGIVRAARTCLDAGAHGITVHPRPDARHTREDDVHALAAVTREYGVEFNLEGNPFAPPRPGYPGFLALCEAVRPAQA